MSTVRMSRYLRQEIRQAYRKANKKAKPPIEYKPSHGDELYNTYVEPAMGKVKKVFEESFGDILSIEKMFEKDSEIRISLDVATFRHSYNKEEETYFVKEEFKENHVLDIPLSTERLFPKSHEGYYNTKITFKLDRHSNKLVDKIAQFYEYNSKLDAITEVQLKKIRELLKQFNTLNQAVRAWPALSKLVSQDKLNKIHEKQQRKRIQAQQKEKADKVVVDSELNETILSASLLGDK